MLDIFFIGVTRVLYDRPACRNGANKGELMSASGMNLF
jgi:hypothetical protein